MAMCYVAGVDSYMYTHGYGAAAEKYLCLYYCTVAA